MMTPRERDEYEDRMLREEDLRREEREADDRARSYRLGIPADEAKR